MTLDEWLALIPVFQLEEERARRCSRRPATDLARACQLEGRCLQQQASQGKVALCNEPATSRAGDSQLARTPMQTYVAKRSDLVRIAARLFKEQGFKSTKLADIARAAGLDRATVYYYVGSKEELFQEAVEGVLDSNRKVARELAADKSLRSLERLHRIFVRLMISYEENYPATFVYIQEQMHQVGTEETAWAKAIMKKTRAFDHLLTGLHPGRNR